MALDGANGTSPTFVAPVVTEGSIVLTFELTVLQGVVTATDNVTVTVVPTPDVPGQPEIPSEAQVLTWMQELAPLPKIHYSFGIHEDLLLPPVQPTLVEFVRLTNDPTEGIENVDGKVDLPEGPGSGGSLKPEAEDIGSDAYPAPVDA